MRRSFHWILLVATLASARVAAAQSVDEQVQGTCRTPREAMLQLLYWVQDRDNRVDPPRAAACLDATGLEPSVAAARALELKRTLDARAVYVDVDAIPSDPEYLNPQGERRWRLADLH
jgi:hypothetical protein